MSSRSDPIGVFDSGIGGLTVVRELMRQLPHERLVYFGDTARVPYGPKSPDTVRRYSREIARFLRGEGVKTIVVACNTATAHALPCLREELDVAVIGVIEPGARAAVAVTRSSFEHGAHGHVGIIGTAGTIASHAYERAIHALDSNIRITARSCPLFAPLIEEGLTDHDATMLIAREYLSPLVDAGVDTLVLGCTHYPLLTPLIQRIVGSGVRLVDSAAETAAETGRVLRECGLDAADATPVHHRFIASDAPEQFLELGRRFLGSAIECVEVRTLG